MIIILVITFVLVVWYRRKLLVVERNHLDLVSPSGRLEMSSETEQVGSEQHVNAVRADNSELRELTPSGMLRYPDAEITESGRITTWE